MVGPGSWWALLALACLIGIPALAVAVPEYLHTRGRAAASSLMPAWLAGFASVLTAAFILVLHSSWGGQSAPLGQAPVGVLSVAAFGVAVLLTPFYRAVATQCLQRGIAAVFDPARWWSAWCVAYQEMRAAPAATGEAGGGAVPGLADGTEVSGGGRGTGGTGG
jgi:hypothetical protein